MSEIAQGRPRAPQVLLGPAFIEGRPRHPVTIRDRCPRRSFLDLPSLRVHPPHIILVGGFPRRSFLDLPSLRGQTVEGSDRAQGYARRSFLDLPSLRGGQHTRTVT